jgi:hypothetical protein
MWLNVMILGFASLTVGFLLGWVFALPKRWDYVWDTTTVTVPAADEPPIGAELTR